MKLEKRARKGRKWKKKVGYGKLTTGGKHRREKENRKREERESDKYRRNLGR